MPTQGGVGIRDAGQAGSQHSSHDEPGQIVSDPETLPACEEPTAQSATQGTHPRNGDTPVHVAFCL